jgi:NCAIR mutase (PurE)-related protein
MDPEKLQALLEAVHAGETSVAGAMDSLRELPYQELPYARVDTQRALRTGYPEDIYCPGKTPAQIAGIIGKLRQAHDRVLATRCDVDTAEAVRAVAPDLTYHETARALTWGHPGSDNAKVGVVALFAAGTADLPVAEEAALTVEMAGVEVRRVYDVGVAGIHRLMDQRHQLANADAVIVVAGMEGALASVIGGLTDRTVIGVPTSVGYGASFGGLAALLAMLNSCAAGLTVVNIDNGFGAAVAASVINRR